MKQPDEWDEAAFDELHRQILLHVPSPYDFVMEAILSHKVPDTGFIVIPADWGVAS